MDDEQLLNSYDAKFDIGILKQPGFKKFKTSRTPSTEVVRGLDYGKSKYDVGLLSNVSLNQDGKEDSFGSQELISENRAQRQPWLSKLGSGTGRVITKAGIEVLKMVPTIGGTIIGGIGEIFDSENNQFFETAVNNSWIKSLDNLNETVNTELLPVYVKKAVENGNIWENFKSIDFWAKEGADGLGYMLAMFAPGAIINKMGIGAKLFAGVNKIGAMGSKVDDAVSVLGKINVTPGSINVTSAAIANTIFEAGAEAKGAGDSYVARMQPKLDSGEISQEDFDIGKGEAMRDVFISNVTILAVPNLIMAKMLWGKGLNKATGNIVDDAGKVLTTMPTKSLLSKVGEGAKTFGKGSLREGFFEEGMQSVAEEYHVNRAVKGEQRGEGVLNTLKSQFDLLGDLGPAYIDMITSVEGQKAVLLGSMMGGPMQVVTNILQKNQESKALNNLLPELAKLDSFYQIFTGDVHKEDGTLDPKKFKDKAQAIGLSEHLSEYYDKAIASGDEKTIESMRAFVSGELIKNFIFNDELGLTALHQYFEQSKTIEEVALKEKKEVEDISKTILSRAEKLSQDFNTFSQFAPALVKLENENATADDKKRFYNKLASTYISSKNAKYFYEEQIDKTKTTRSNLLMSLGLPVDLDLLSDTGVELSKNNFAIKELNDDIAEFTATLEEVNKQDNEFWNKVNHEKTFAAEVKDRENLEKALEAANQVKIEAIQKKISEAKTPEELDNITYTNTVADKALKVAVAAKKAQLKDEITAKGVEQANKQKETTNENKENKEVEEEEAEDNIEEIVSNYNVGELVPISQELINNSNGQLDESDLYNHIVLASPDDITATTITLEVMETGAVVVINKKVTKEVEVNLESEFNTDGSDNHDKLIPKTNENNETGDELKRGNGTPILSYDRVKKTKLSFVDDKFISLEQDPRNKKGVAVNFAVNRTSGEVVPTDSSIVKTSKANWNKAVKIYDRLVAGETLTKEEIDTLINYLPINVVLGEQQAPIHTKYTSNGTSNKFDNSSKLLRTKIVNALIAKSSIEEITGEIEGQYAGELQVDGKVDGKVAENSVLDLHFLYKISQERRVGEVKKRLGFVNALGQLQFIDGTIYPYFDKTNTAGEIYMIIPMANGFKFPLKLNIQKINKTDADLLASLYELRLQNDTVEKSTTLSEIKNPELIKQIKETFAEEIKLIGKPFNDVTLKDIVDFLIWDMSKSTKSRVKFTGTKKKGVSNFVYGNSKTTGKVIENAKDFNKEHFSQWLQNNKRYNINIKPKKGSTTKATIETNDNYLTYLLSNKILNTNAVVGEFTPTFQGFSGIYLNSDKVNVSGGAKTEIIPIIINSKSNIDLLINKVVDFVNNKSFTPTELLSKHWKTKEPLLKNKIKQLQDLLKAGIKNGEDIRKLTDLLNIIRGTLNEGININDSVVSQINSDNIAELANSILQSIPDDIIQDYIRLMDEVMESRVGINAVDKMLIQYSDKSGYTIDGKNQEYFLTRDDVDKYLEEKLKRPRKLTDAENQSNIETIRAEDLVREMVKPNGRPFTDFTAEERKLIDTVPVARKKELKLQEEQGKENFEDILEPSQEITYKGKKYTVAIVNGNGVITNEKGTVILSSSPIGTAIQNLVNWDTLEENKPEKIRKFQEKVVPLHEVPNTTESKVVEELKQKNITTDTIEVTDDVIVKIIIELSNLGHLQLGSDIYNNIMGKKTNAEKFEAIRIMAEERKLNIATLLLKCK